MEYRSIRNGNRIPAVMLGSFQLDRNDMMNQIVLEAAKNDSFGFDTSPSYRTEKDLSDAIKRCMKALCIAREKFFVQTKIDSWQMIAKKGNIRPYVVNALKKMGLDYWDALLIHWPQPEYLVPTWLCFEELYKEGLVKSIGVCNFELRHFEKLKMSGASMTPMIVQNEIHPFNIDEDVVSFCHKNDILVQAYSPLCRMLDKVVDNNYLREIALAHNKSIAQIILRWHIERGIIPIVKTGNQKRIPENLSVLDFDLKNEEINLISSLNDNFKIFLGSRCCPGY